MDHNQLDKKLRTLTEREIAYQEHPFLSSSYKSHEITEYEGKEVYVFASQIPPNENITISKHNRFAEVPLHIHTFIEISYVYSGQCIQTINGQTVTLKQGQVCIVDTGVPHEILPTTENDIIINILIRKDYFSSSFFSRLSNSGIISDFLVNAISDTQNHNRYIIFHSEKNNNIPLLIKQLLCEYFDKSLCSGEIIDCYMVLIFSELLRVFQYDTNQRHVNSYSHTKTIEILQYIEKNYRACTLVSTAIHFNFNPNYLSTLIKKATGKSFKELIQTEKLKYSSFLLANTDIPVYEIANKTGNGNLSFFYKKFKNYFGVTPQEYRQIQKSKSLL
ncbi:AraC family transcriptional regulator [Priestia megaterium]|uniref:AraC family transcriptional regulator n=1 Tax=Priestia megaterium TaxID=1404 RepID=UPI0027955FB6|nr:helix-turn-helix domain-containing protein [Priestia megaterium]